MSDQDQRVQTLLILQNLIFLHLNFSGMYFVHQFRNIYIVIMYDCPLELNNLKPARSSISHGLVSKIIPNLPIWGIKKELRGIMVNTGRIHREFRYFRDIF